MRREITLKLLSYPMLDWRFCWFWECQNLWIQNETCVWKKRRRRNTWFSLIYMQDDCSDQTEQDNHVRTDFQKRKVLKSCLSWSTWRVWADVFSKCLKSFILIYGFGALARPVILKVHIRAFIRMWLFDRLTKWFWIILFKIFNLVCNLRQKAEIDIISLDAHLLLCPFQSIFLIKQCIIFRRLFCGVSCA